MSDRGLDLQTDVGSLYGEHHGWLHKWLWRRLGNASDAADLAHDVFLRLILKPAPQGFDSFGAARAYLRSMAQGLCINLWHRREIEQAWLDTLAALRKPAPPPPNARPWYWKPCRRSAPCCWICRQRRRGHFCSRRSAA